MLEILVYLKLHLFTIKNNTITKTQNLKTKNSILIIFLYLIYNVSFGQTARVKGIVLDENNKPVEKVNITDGKSKTVTNENGFYALSVEANKKISLIFTHVSLSRISAASSAGRGKFT